MMSTNHIIIFLVSFFSIFHSSAQSKSGEVHKKKKSLIGFYGNRFVLQLGASIHHNSLLKLVDQSEKNYRDNYTKLHPSSGFGHINYSFYSNAGFQIKEKIALSIDFNYYLGTMVIEDYGYKPTYSGNPSQGKTARINYQTIRIMPRIEIGSHGSNSPSGLSHIIGLGLELSKAKSKNYDAIVSDTTDDYLHYLYGHYEKDLYIQFPSKAAFNLTIMYGLEYRLPLTKNIAINFGGYFHLNIPQILLADFINISQNNADDYTFKNDFSVTRTMNLFSIRTGLVFMI